MVLTGAGISRESGLSTFRDPDGIWAKVRVEEVATPDAFRHDPERVHAFYNTRRRALQEPRIQPNAAHRALAEFERVWPGELLLVTQNIDDLHERAGSPAPVHMHGELLKARCEICEDISQWVSDLTTQSVCPGCGTKGGLRPHVVWFGEMPLEMDRILGGLAEADLFVAIGTSGTVYPAAGFVAEARAAGAHTVELNLEPSQNGTLFAESRYGTASQVVPTYLAGLRACS